jgi:hypothetical protein
MLERDAGGAGANSSLRASACAKSERGAAAAKKRRAAEKSANKAPPFHQKAKKKGLRRSDAKAPRTSEPRIAVK